MVVRLSAPVLVLFVCVLVSCATASQFRYGTISWRSIAGEENTVEFELVTAWRRDFLWSTKNGLSSAGGPEVGDVVRVTGLSFADADGLKATTEGTSSIAFNTGDGRSYLVDVEVTAVSEVGNWFMGVWRKNVTYASAFASATPFYPTGVSYTSDNQPMQNTPWLASFGGCCKVGGLQNNANARFNITTMVDLSDRPHSPALRSLPVISVPLSANTSMRHTFAVAARQQVGVASSAVAMSGGNTAYSADDNVGAPLQFAKATAADLSLDNTAYQEPAGTVISVDVNTGIVTFQTSTPGMYNLALVVSSGTARVVVDLIVHAHSVAMPSVQTPSGEVETSIGWVGFPIHSNIEASTHNSTHVQVPLVLSYVFSHLMLSATHDNSIREYLGSGRTVDSAGLPSGATLRSLANSGSLVTDLAISFDNPFGSHRPGHDYAVARESRDFVGHPLATSLSSQGYTQVAQDLNAGTGGAAVYVWKRSSSNAPAITDVLVTSTAEQRLTAEADGYSMVEGNLNEGSGGVQTNLWFKRGSGAAVADITAVRYPASGPDGFEPVSGNTNAPAMGTAQVLLAVKKEAQDPLKRELMWTPEDPGHYVFCMEAVIESSGVASPQSCIDYSVSSDPAPFVRAPQSASAVMGKKLEIIVTAEDQPQDTVQLDLDVSSNIGGEHGAVMSSVEVDSVNATVKRIKRVLSWEPNSAWGGFTGDICWRATDGSGKHHVGCTTVTVARCIWHVNAEDTMIDIAARFKTNWLQLWHFNPTLMHPDHALSPGSEINIGHEYEVEPNDSLHVISRRFGTQVEHIQDLNYDLNRGVTVSVGQSLCIIPNSCVTAAHIGH